MNGTVITIEEWMVLWLRQRNGRDCDYDREMDGIVITTEDWTEL